MFSNLISKWATIGVSILTASTFILSSIVYVKKDTIAVEYVIGKNVLHSKPGLNFKQPFTNVTTYNLAPRTTSVFVPTQTKDNLPLVVDIDIRYKVDQKNILKLSEVFGSDSAVDNYINSISQQAVYMNAQSISQHDLIHRQSGVKAEVRANLEKEIKLQAAQCGIRVQNIDINID
eukprot:TRINITY_DN7461_c0_g1_i1.p1 TRINITY_DN7461_c0_g1~~TRINITY_DN7461_c0_g1_i1.p1  ORF type:complete len:186 (-),score=59.02 TRINITY_DN7461_c0_g1_i1:60-587(-)